VAGQASGGSKWFDFYIVQPAIGVQLAQEIREINRHSGKIIAFSRPLNVKNDSGEEEEMANGES